MIRTRTVVWLVAVVLSILVLQGAAVAGPTWSAFDEATWTGITVTATTPYDYILSVGSAPTVTFGGTTYDVSWVQGFYFLGKDATTTFNAEGVDKTGWKWATAPPGEPYNVAGWAATGNSNRVTTDGSTTFALSSFDSPADTMFGLHLGYWDGATMVTRYFRPDVPVPEPSGILALAAGLGGLATYIRRRRQLS